jgi:leucyl-tRNA synthetase
VNTKEPFQRLVNQGMILGEDNQKMSKSRGNVINPDDIITEYGADSMRVYEMFLGPLEVSKPWMTAGLVGVSRFLERLWAIGEKVEGGVNRSDAWSLREAQTPEGNPERVSPATPPPALVRLLHQTGKKVTHDTASLNFNTAISQMMIYSAELAKLPRVPRPLWEPLVKMASAYAPHLGEELWEKLGYNESISKSPWPDYDEALTLESEATIVVQINGKVRDKFAASPEEAGTALEERALALPSVQRWLEGQSVVKVITVPGKLVNIVARQA